MKPPRKPPHLSASDLRKFKEALLPITAELRAIRKQLARIEGKTPRIVSGRIGEECQCPKGECHKHLIRRDLGIYCVIDPKFVHIQANGETSPKSGTRIG